MQGTKKYIQFFRNNLFLIVLLFALSPCSVKEVLHQQFDVAYNQPLNKTKTTLNQQSNCSVGSDFISEQKQESKKQTESNFLPDFEKKTFQNNTYSLARKSSEIQAFQIDLAHLFPPKYILFKRLKIDIV